MKRNHAFPFVILALASIFSGCRDQQDASVTAGIDSLLVATPELTMRPGEVLDILTVIHRSAMEAALLGAEKATNQRVRAFAQRVASEHRGLLELDGGAADRAGVERTGVTDPTLAGMHQETMRMLRQTPRGAAFDSLFIELQVRVHQEALERVGERPVNVRDEAFHEHIRNTVRTLQAHLDDALSLRRSLAERRATPGQPAPGSGNYADVPQRLSGAS